MTQIGIPQIPLVYVSGEFRNVGLGGSKITVWRPTNSLSARGWSVTKRYLMLLFESPKSTIIEVDMVRLSK